MAELFNITHDADNLDEYDSTVTDGGDLSTGTPGLRDTTAKMEATIDSTGNMWGQKTVVVSTNQLRFRFYIDSNGLTMASGDEFSVVQVFVDTVWVILFIVSLGYDGADYYIFAHGVDDEENWDKVTADYTITDDVHYIEVLGQREVSDGSGDGVLSLWIDGALKETVSTVDNYALWANTPKYWRLGAWGLDAGTGGEGEKLYLDEFVANDDGGEIGAVRKIKQVATVDWANVKAVGTISEASVKQVATVNIN